MPTFQKDPITGEDFMISPFPYDVTGVGSVLSHEGGVYTVLADNGRVYGYASQSGSPSTEKAAAEIAYAMANPPPFPNPVPEVVRSAALRYVLNARNLRSAVEAAVAAADQNAKDAWEFEVNIRRDHPLVAGFASALGFSGDQVDDIFRAAAQL